MAEQSKRPGASSPQQAALLGALLVKWGFEDGSPSTVVAGRKLLEQAEQDWPTPVPEDKRVARQFSKP